MSTMPVFGPRARWKAVAITSEDPTEFAKNYEDCLNTLVADGWNIAGMMPRGDSLIVTAQKPELPELPEAEARALRAALEAPRPRRDSQSEVMYTYREEGAIRSITCPSLQDATKYLEEHAKEESEILPISIVVMSVTSYEPADLPFLLRQTK